MRFNNDFHKHLRSTLNHLYHPDYLRTCLLASLLGLRGRLVAPITLQEIMINEIEKLKNKSFGPLETHPSFYYDLLYYRYVQKLTQEEVANQLGVSIRQFAREQDRAVDLLAKQLLEQYPALAESFNGPVGEPNQAQAGEGIGVDELSWLEKELPGQPVILSREMDTVLELVDPLTRQYQVRVLTDLSSSLPGLAVHPVALRQALISVIHAAIHQERGEHILIKSAQDAKMATITISVSGDAPERNLAISPDDQASLDMAARFIEKSKGTIDVQSTNNRFEARVHLPIFYQQVVLLIDDNEDFHQLAQRYLSDTRYQLVCTNSPSDAIEMAGKHAVQLILLDVMMPEIDGWQVLGQLRRNPKTSHIPVIICTIIAQEDLAYSLGASACLRKPVRREDLIKTLDRLAAAAASVSC